MDRLVAGQSEAVFHYRTGPDPGQVRQLGREAERLLPGLAVCSTRGDSCVTTNTPGKLAPYIDRAPAE